VKIPSLTPRGWIRFNCCWGSPAPGLASAAPASPFAPFPSAGHGKSTRPCSDRARPYCVHHSVIKDGLWYVTLLESERGGYGDLAIYASEHGDIVTRQESYADLVMDRLEQNLFSEIGHLHVGAVDAPVLLGALRKVEMRGTAHVSKKVRQHAGQVFRFAIGTGRATRDPSVDLQGRVEGAASIEESCRA
jgi:hypothetical protein